MQYCTEAYNGTFAKLVWSASSPDIATILFWSESINKALIFHHCLVYWRLVTASGTIYRPVFRFLQSLMSTADVCSQYFQRDKVFIDCMYTNSWLPTISSLFGDIFFHLSNASLNSLWTPLVEGRLASTKLKSKLFTQKIIVALYCHFWLYYVSVSSIVDIGLYIIYTCCDAIMAFIHSNQPGSFSAEKYPIPSCLTVVPWKYQSINNLFVLRSTKTSKCTIQCRTGHKGMKHLQVPETKPNNKNPKNHQKILTMHQLEGQWLHKLLQG